MSLVNVLTMQAVDPKHNGGWSRVNDGVTVYIEKDGVTITLDTEDTIQLMKTLKGINPTIQIS